MNLRKEMETALKERIQQFWNRKPCGTGGDVPVEPNKDYFEKIRERRYRLEPFILKIIEESNLKDKKVLEIGCGVGTDGVSLTRTGADYTGVDLSQESLRLARKNFELNGFQPERIKEADAENLPFEDNSFDFIYSWGVLHHTTNIIKSIEEAKRVLKPGGKFVIMLYNRHSSVGLQLWGVYGLLRLKPFISWEKLFYEHHESPGTKAFTGREMKDLFSRFKSAKIENVITPYDMRISRNNFLPLSFSRIIPLGYGFFWVAKGEK